MHRGKRDRGLPLPRACSLKASLHQRAGRDDSDTKGRAAIPGQVFGRPAGLGRVSTENSLHLSGPCIHLGHGQRFSPSLSHPPSQEQPCSAA